MNDKIENLNIPRTSERFLNDFSFIYNLSIRNELFKKEDKKILFFIYFELNIKK